MEDNETIRSAFSILLEENGYAVLQAGSGEAALRLAQAEDPDLILMDIGLPDVSGLEVTRRLKTDDRTSRIPVVALTGRTLESDTAMCYAAGCVGYLTKPIDATQLLDKIDSFIRA